MTRILLIEDEQYIRELYEKLLKEEGHVVDTAKDGEEGLTKATEGGYDLILLDIILPTLDGLSILQNLRKNPPGKPNRKIAILTVLREERYVNVAKALGCADFMVKSALTPKEFVERVKQLLEPAHIPAH